MRIGIAVVGADHSLNRLPVKNVAPSIADFQSLRKPLRKFIEATQLGQRVELRDLIQFASQTLPSFDEVLAFGFSRSDSYRSIPSQPGERNIRGNIFHPPAAARGYEQEAHFGKALRIGRGRPGNIDIRTGQQDHLVGLTLWPAAESSPKFISGIGLVPKDLQQLRWRKFPCHPKIVPNSTFPLILRCWERM